MNTERAFQFYLASQSPRRIELLSNFGFTFQTLSFEIDEASHSAESAVDYVQRLAKQKATAALKLRKLKNKPVLAADTTVVIGEKILGKPTDINHAKSMLKLLSGRQHSVYTAVCFALSPEKSQTIISKSIIEFDDLTDDEINAYCKTLEPMDKAGAYAIQGFAAAFIKRIDGSYSGVMGLPMHETVKLLKSYGIKLFNEPAN